MKVVIVEDQADFRDLLTDFFREEGHEVMPCADAEEAFALLTSTKPSPPSPDTILITDLMMPGMGGVELVRRLSENKVKLKVAVLSAYLNERVASRLARLGVLAVMTKPVDLTKLGGVVKAMAEGKHSGMEPKLLSPEEEREPQFATTPKTASKPAVQTSKPAPVSPVQASKPVATPAAPKQALPSTEPPATPAPKPAEQPKPASLPVAREGKPAPQVSSEKKHCPPSGVFRKAEMIGAVEGGCVRVMIADDDPDFALLLKDVLSDEGYAVTVAKNGLEAVERSLSEDFYIVFMDLMMPGLGGVEAIRRIRRAEPGLLIVAMTGKASPVDQAQAMQAGAFKVLEKPIDTDSFRRHLAQWSLIAERRRMVTDKYARIEPPRVRIFGFSSRRWIALIIFLLAVLLGMLVPPVHRAIIYTIQNVGTGLGGIGRAIGVLERTEGYLQRDENREMERERR